jgi:hypothetical protein
MLKILSPFPFEFDLLYCVSLTWPNHVFQHLFVLLQQPTVAVTEQNAKEDVLGFCDMCHTLDDINVCMLRPNIKDIFDKNLSNTVCVLGISKSAS